MCPGSFFLRRLAAAAKAWLRASRQAVTRKQGCRAMCSGTYFSLEALFLFCARFQAIQASDSLAIYASGDESYVKLILENGAKACLVVPPFKGRILATIGFLYVK